MSRLKYFLLSLNVLNGLLAIAVAAVVYGTVAPLLNPAISLSPPPAKRPSTPAVEKKALALTSPPVDYAVVSEQNLFHPDRKIPPEKQAEKAIPRPDVVLYGTLITAETAFAFVEDRKAPYSTAGRGKRQITLKKGDNLSGYTLSEIGTNRIVLVKGEDRVVVMLDDKGKRRSEEASGATAAGRAASSGGASAQPLMPSTPQSVPAPAKPGTAPGGGTAAPGPIPSTVQPAAPSRTGAGTGTGAAGAVPSSATQAEASTKPGIGASGTWPPTRSTIEQTRQKILEGRQLRSSQTPQN